MAVQAKAIKQKIKGVGNIRKITRTMEMVSVSKMKRAVSSALSLRPYARESFVLMNTIVSSSLEKHPLFRNLKEKGKTLVIIVASSKGLCGSYNTNVYRELSRFSKTATGLTAITIGKQAEKIAKRVGAPIMASFIDWGDKIDWQETSVLTTIIEKKFIEGEYESVQILYTQFVKAMQYRATTKQLLPIQKKVFESIIEEIAEGEHQKSSVAVTKAEPLYEPSEGIVLNSILPRLLHAIVHEALLESQASEHSSRMFAMKTATDNAKEMLDDLKISYNRARQDAVTQELAEIAAGAGAI